MSQSPAESKKKKHSIDQISRSSQDSSKATWLRIIDTLDFFREKYGATLCYRQWDVTSTNKVAIFLFKYFQLKQYEIIN